MLASTNTCSTVKFNGRTCCARRGLAVLPPVAASTSSSVASGFIIRYCRSICALYFALYTRCIPSYRLTAPRKAAPSLFECVLCSRLCTSVAAFSGEKSPLSCSRRLSARRFVWCVAVSISTLSSIHSATSCINGDSFAPLARSRLVATSASRCKSSMRRMD